MVTKYTTCSKVLLVLLSLLCCSCLSGQNTTTQLIEFRDYDVNKLNAAVDWVQTVFDLPASRMQAAPKGVRLSIDVNDPGPYNYTYRSELRERNINTYPQPNTSQVYHVQFEVNELPDLYGPITIFQRFNRDNDGPDIEVELTGKNQFSNAVANDLQVVAFKGPRQRLGKFLKPINDLMVIIYTSGNGKYKVSLNGETLSEGEGINTLGATAGTWTQFGIYPHGLHSERNRQDQKNSGNTKVAFTYYSYSKTEYEYEVDLKDFNTVNLNSGDPDPDPDPTPQDTCSGNPPQFWQMIDVGNPTLGGQACETGSVIDIRSAGSDIWNTKDEFYYVYNELQGDIEVEAQILNIGPSNFWAKGGIMIREGLQGDAKNVYMCLTQEGRWSFQRRTTTADSTRSIKSDPAQISFPHYVKLVRKNDWFWGYSSTDAQTWILADSIEVPMADPVYMGLAATSHEAALLNATVFDKISITTPSPGTGCVDLPGWESQDLGAVGLAGKACVEGEEIHISASGSDIWNNEDQFFFVYQVLSGNWEVSARVLEIGESNAWAKAGLMIREGLAPGAKNAFMTSTAGQRWSFQFRQDSAGITEGVLNSNGTFTYPHWLKLVREDSMFFGLYSVDSVNWEIIAAAAIDMPDEILLGIAATSHNNAVLNQAKLDQLNFKAAEGGPGTLPVAFTDFYGVKNQGRTQIDLFWEVAMEQGNDYFTIQRSLDGAVFENLGTVASLGNTRQLRSYNFTDANPSTGNNRYRLKQTDLDGQFSYSQQIEVSLTGESSNTLSVYPVPAQAGDELHVNLSWGSTQAPMLEFRDLLGRLLFKKELNPQEIQESFAIDTSSLQAGLYYVTVSDAQGAENTLSQKVFIR